MRFDKAAFLILAGVWAACFSAAATAVEEGDTAPRWHAADFDGRAVDFPAIAGGKPAVVVFWATWCGPCKVISPIFERFEAQFPSLEFYKVDVDQAEAISQEVGVRAVRSYFPASLQPQLLTCGRRL